MSYEKRLDELRLVVGARQTAYAYRSSLETKMIPYVVGWVARLAPPTEEQLLLLQEVDDFLTGESRRLPREVEKANATIQKLELSHAQHMDHVRSQLVAAETESANLRAEIAALQETIAKHHTDTAQGAAAQSKVKMPELPDVGAMQTAVASAIEQLGGIGRQLKDPSQ